MVRLSLRSFYIPFLHSVFYIAMVRPRTPFANLRGLTTTPEGLRYNRLDQPRSHRPDRDGNYIPKAFLNQNFEWVTHARVKNDLYYAIFVADSPLPFDQSREMWQPVCVHYNLIQVGGHGSPKDVIKGMVRTLRQGHPPRYVRERRIIRRRWRDENNNVHHNMPRTNNTPPPSPRGANVIVEPDIRGDDDEEENVEEDVEEDAEEDAEEEENEDDAEQL